MVLKPERKSSYEQYKSSLHAIFDGTKPLPERFKGTAAVPLKPSPQPKKNAKKRVCVNTAEVNYSVLLKTIEQASGVQEISTSINTLLLAGYNLPDDENLLSKALCHENEIVAIGVLEKLLVMLPKRKPRNLRLLKSRLENASLLAKDMQVKELCEQISKMIFGLA